MDAPLQMQFVVLHDINEQDLIENSDNWSFNFGFFTKEDAEELEFQKIVGFVTNFEFAIDSLRNGDLEYTNESLNILRLPTIPQKYIDYELPMLTDKFTDEQLEEYLKFADLIEQK